MFAIFSLRRPNILPVGDLGVQRGILRWILSQHSDPGSPVKLNKKSAPDDDPDQMDLDQSQSQSQSQPQTQSQSQELEDATANVVAATGSMAPPQTPKKAKKGDAIPNGSSIPPPFTPSIDRVLRVPVVPTPLPTGLTISELKSRLSGKKKVK
jgi:DNA-3-methyladenine glycosylase II